MINTSIIEIEKNNSGEHKLSPENESLSPDSDRLSTAIKEDLSTKLSDSGHTEHTGDKLDYIMEDVDEEFNYRSNSINSQCISCPKPTDARIVHNHPFYHCIEYPKFQNIHLEVIESHLILAKDHQ